MDNLNGLLKELKTLVGGTDEANRRRFTEILDELEAHKNEPKVQEALDLQAHPHELHRQTLFRQVSIMALPAHQREQGRRAPVHAQRRTKSHVQPCLTRHSQTHQLVFHCLIRWITHFFI